MRRRSTEQLLGSAESLPEETQHVPTEAIQVVCVAVTPARQDWRSLTTGRRYDVLSLNGVRGAKPGDRGMAFMTRRGWQVKAVIKPEDEQRS